MTAHDQVDVETVAEALWRWKRKTFPNHPTETSDYEPQAHAVLAALDLPARERKARAEALREAADHAQPLGYATTSTDAVRTWLRTRAAELDPQGARDE